MYWIELDSDFYFWGDFIKPSHTNVSHFTALTLSCFFVFCFLFLPAFSFGLIFFCEHTPSTLRLRSNPRLTVHHPASLLQIDNGAFIIYTKELWDYFFIWLAWTQRPLNACIAVDCVHAGSDKVHLDTLATKRCSAGPHNQYKGF